MRSRRVSGRNPRASRACARCRRRKIKCDFVYPSCGTCASAGVDCLGYDTITGEEQPRSRVTFLENKIAQLELELASLQGRSVGDEDFEHENPAQVPAFFVEYRAQLLQSATLNHGYDRSYDAEYDTAPWRSVPYISPSLLPTLVPTQTVSEIPPSKDNAIAQERDIASIPRNVVDIMLRHYAEFYLAQYPIVDESDLIEQCNRVYERTASPFDLFVVCMALSISAHTLIRHDQERATKAADEFWETAITNLDVVFKESTLIQLQAIMLLCHYSFANPSVVNSRMCSRAAMTLCVQLGLHKEPPPESIRSCITLESQRRIFWTCYVFDAQMNMLRSQPSTVIDINVSVHYPTVEGLENKDGDRVAIANFLYTFRQLEAEITLGLFQFDTCGDARIATPQWLDETRARIDSWQDRLDSRHFASRIEFRYIMCNFQRLRLNRITPRMPLPTNAMRRECIAAGLSIASHFSRLSRQGSFFYWNHCCWHFFEIGIVLVESTHTGLDMLKKRQESFLDFALAMEISRVMQTIPVVLSKMVHRWPQIRQMVLELEDLFHPALHRLEAFIAGRPFNVDMSNHELIAYQVSSIKKHLLANRTPTTWHQEDESPGSYNQFGMQVSAAQNLLSMTKQPNAESTMTMEEVLQVLQPDDVTIDSALSQQLTVNQAAGIEPVFGIENTSMLYGAESVPLTTALEEHNLYAGLNPDTNWLSPTGNSLFWHGNGLDLDDIFTAFDEGNIHDRLM